VQQNVDTGTRIHSNAAVTLLEIFPVSVLSIKMYGSRPIQQAEEQWISLPGS
jgi:hypothetical protein